MPQPLGFTISTPCPHAFAPRAWNMSSTVSACAPSFRPRPSDAAGDEAEQRRRALDILEAGPVPRPHDRQGTAGERGRRDRDRAADLGRHRRGGHGPLRLHHRPHLPRPQPHRGRAPGPAGGRRLRPRRAWRPSPTSICCSCGPTSRPPARRERDRVHALRPVGPGLQSRPRLADRRGVREAQPARTSRSAPRSWRRAS